MRESHDLEALAQAVADGTPLDWDRIESSVDEESRATVRSLRAMSTIAGLHRTLGIESSQAPVPAARTGERAVPTDHPLATPLARWGHFALEQRIGAGSFGDVFRAIDTHLDRVVAVKLARGDHNPSTPLVAGRDLNASLVEARLLARVRHPNVAAVYGADVFDGQPGLWMEFIDGLTLSTVLMRQGPFAEAEAATIGLHLCRALAAVHVAGLLHRDIKAQNVMRESGGRIVLMDFGGGREVAPRPALGGDTGTPLYLAPEVLNGRPATTQSDVYALGVLLYHLATREFPVKGADSVSLTAAHRAGVRVSLAERRPDLSPRFARVVERATAADPESRYPSAGAMAADLATVLHADIDETTIGVSGSVASSVGSGFSRKLQRMGLAAAALLLATGVTLGVWWAFIRSPASAALPVGSILVLPLNDASEGEPQPYLAAGFTNVLSEDLGRIRSLRIVRSARANQTTPSDPRALAREVGADAFIQGTLRRRDGRIAVDVRLVDARNGRIHWSGSFDRAADEGLSMHREIARTLASELRVALSSEEHRALTSTAQVSARVQDAYLRGWAEYQRLSRDGALEAARQFEEVIALQPTFAPAHAALSHVYWTLGTSFKTMPREESRSKAEAAGLRAMELDPTLPNAYAALGQVRFYFDWNWQGAEELFRRARELNPNVAQVRSQYGWLLAVVNRLEPALQEMRAALELEPDNVSRRASVAGILYYSRRFTAAIEEIDRAVALDPNSPVAHLAKARYLADADRPQEALAEIALARYRNEPAVTAELARIQVKSGKLEEARRLLPELVAAAADGRLANDHLAFVHLALGEKENALAFLEAALADRSPTLVWIHVDPRFDALRGDARFVNLLRQMGFVQ